MTPMTVTSAVCRLDALNKPVRNSMGVKEPLLGSTRLKLEVSRHMEGFLKLVGFPPNLHTPSADHF